MKGTLQRKKKPARQLGKALVPVKEEDAVQKGKNRRGSFLGAE